jgi:hypothetical protein
MIALEQSPHLCTTHNNQRIISFYSMYRSIPSYLYVPVWYKYNNIKLIISKQKNDNGGNQSQIYFYIFHMS